MATKRRLPQIQESDFHKVINEAIKANRHKEQLIQILAESLPTCVDQRGVAPIQYPPCDDHCPMCQVLKKAGEKMQWFLDEDADSNLIPASQSIAPGAACHKLPWLNQYK